MLTQLVTECCCCLEDKTCFENLGWRRLLTQLVTGCCCYLEDKTLFWKSWVEEGVDTVGNGVLLLFGGQDFF